MHLEAERSDFSIVVALAVTVVATALATAPHSTASAAERTWIVGAVVLSPEHTESPREANVLIEGDRIAAVTATAPTADDGSTVFDARGGVLIPGLIDGHVHLASVPGMTPLMGMRHPEIANAYRTQLPRSYLRYGYTTVIDLNVADPSAIEAFRAAPAHPDEYDCGASLPMANGYPSQNVPPELRFKVFPNYLYDPTQVGHMPPDAAPETQSPEAAVARVKAKGGVCIKTYYEPGFGSFDGKLPVPTVEIMARIVRAARAAELPVLLHANSIRAQRFGVETDVTVMAHGMWRWGDLAAMSDLPPEAKDVLDKIVERRIGYMPTMQVIGGLRAVLEPHPFDRPDVRRVLPKALIDWYATPEGGWFKEELARGGPVDRIIEAYDGLLSHDALSVRYLAAKNARFLFGTDTPSAPTAINLPGLNGYLEMKRLAAAGMSLRQVFEAATLNNAEAFGLSGQLGTIASGKRANLVLLAQSPLLSVEAYDTVRAVWIGGRLLDPARLEAGN
jgi:imidazolonepropionase-like amidohydrolase